ncbi:MAG: spore coat associated protein CotJA [Acutalibacteraceae bacterium]|nr:spore coat associated protein CotJA [Acutalibacteraceae bacterium]
MFEEIYNFENINRAISKSQMEDMNRTMSKFPKDATEAMAYVPFQSNDKMFSTEQGFVCGTMFTVLNKPFKGCGMK